MSEIGVILAAGMGKRMGLGYNKAFLKIKGKPVIYYTIKAFEESNVDKIVLVARKEEIKDMEEVVKENNFKKVESIIAGGERRQDSSLNGIKEAKRIGAKNVYVHDGARCLILPEQINKMIEIMQKEECCTAGTKERNTMKEVDAENRIIKTIPRDNLMEMQTPQASRIDLLLNAFEKLGDKKITDENMALENIGKKPLVYDCGPENIKITLKGDIPIAEAILSKRGI